MSREFGCHNPVCVRRVEMTETYCCSFCADGDRLGHFVQPHTAGCQGRATKDGVVGLSAQAHLYAAALSEPGNIPVLLPSDERVGPYSDEDVRVTSVMFVELTGDGRIGTNIHQQVVEMIAEDGCGD